MAVVWVFLDGVGLGTDDPAVNPWSAVSDPTLIAVEGRDPSWPEAIWEPLDANLGVDGLPQSATGTTALFTGINAPAALGRHLSGFPPRELQAIIAEHSVHKQALDRGLRPTFANAYNEAYFKRPPFMQSVTTHAVRAAGIPFRMLDEYRGGLAVFHDLTGEMIRDQGNTGRLQYPGAPPENSVAADKFRERFARIHKRSQRKSSPSTPPTTDANASSETLGDIVRRENLPVIGPEEAARRIARLATDHDLVVFEYIKTDLAGHAQDLVWAANVVSEVMRFLRALLHDLNPDKDTLLIASDHGNSEDLSVRTHTRAPVPSVAVGPLAGNILPGCTAITDLVPAVLDALTS
jgi:2,3-bisphosphoglycerate-independent phosphoglycerate mutase